MFATTYLIITLKLYFMKRICYWTIFASVLALFSCNSSEKGTAESKDENKVENKAAQKTEAVVEEKIVSERPSDSKGKFLVKSADLEFDSEIMGMKQNMLMTIDNYGETSFVEMTGNIMGMKSHNISIIKDGFEYSIDMEKKTGIKKPYKPKNNTKDLNFTALSTEMMKEFNMKKEGTEMFLGKKCDKYTINEPISKMKGFYLVWMGIPLKTDISVAGMPMKIVAKKIDLAAAISPDKFNIPKGVTITEETATRKGKK